MLKSIFKLADRMQSMQPNGASKNRDYCFLSFSSFFFPTPKLLLVFWRGFSLPYLWYGYLWYIWWFFWVISFENFWGDFLGNFLTYNLLTIAHNARWRHFSPIRIFPEFFDFDLSISGLDFFCDRDLTFSRQIVAS